MMELLAVAVLALHGIVCAAILVAYLWRAARWREAQWTMPEVRAPEKLEPPDAVFELDRIPEDEIFDIMREFYPAECERYRSGGLGYTERRWLWDSCSAIHEARVEIEELCS